ncbi:MAG: hypothetical protein GOV00_04225, partial [Candidatus Altiarchaeota archaeon]|nr:hypothetical protein [Candidatus Altiarchaeota archaeon]
MNYPIRTIKGHGLMLIVLDGLGDQPIKELGWKTPLEAAKTPVMDQMVKEGQCGLHYPVAPGIAPESTLAHLQLFNYGLEEKNERGVIEVLGTGAEVGQHDFCYRVNFAYVDRKDKLTVMDRRAHRDEFGLSEMAQGLEKVLNKNPLKLKISFKKTLGHRGVLVIKNYRKKTKLGNTDPSVEGLKVTLGDKVTKWLHETSFKYLSKHKLNLEREAQGLVPANAILLRGGGKLKLPKETFKQRNGLNGYAIAGYPTYLGIAKFCGMDTENVQDEVVRIPKAINKLNTSNDFAFVHFKRTDEAAHDGNFRKKIQAIETYDKLLKPLLKSGFTIAIT